MPRHLHENDYLRCVLAGGFRERNGRDGRLYTRADPRRMLDRAAQLAPSR